MSPHVCGEQAWGEILQDPGAVYRAVCQFLRPFIFLRTDFPGRFWKTGGRKVSITVHIYSAHFEVIGLTGLQRWCACDLHFVFLLFLSSLLCHLFHGPLWHWNWKHHCGSPWYSISSHSSCLQSQTSGLCTFSWHWGCQNNGKKNWTFWENITSYKNKHCLRLWRACVNLTPYPFLFSAFLGACEESLPVFSPSKKSSLSVIPRWVEHKLDTL